jgi:ABC-type multidrug transport system ATPase subunit
MVRFSINNESKRGKMDFAFDFTGEIRTGFNIIFGPSGSGKTSLIRNLLGLAPHAILEYPSGQKTRFPMYRNEKVGYLPQGGGVLPRLGLLDNIFLGRELGKGARDYAEKLILDLGLSHLKSNSSNSFSGGEQLRIGLIRTLLADPKYIFLDEPFAGLDPFFKNVCRKVIKNFPGSGEKYVLISTHDLDDSNFFDARLFLLDRGKVQEGINTADGIKSYFEKMSSLD